MAMAIEQENPARKAGRHARVFTTHRASSFQSQPRGRTRGIPGPPGDPPALAGHGSTKAWRCDPAGSDGPHLTGPIRYLSPFPSIFG